MDDIKLQQAVREELMADPKMDHREVAVSVNEPGVVTLRGTVGSLRQKREAAVASKRVFGVKEVKNEPDVRPLVGDRRDDAILRAEVLQALSLNSLVPSGIDAMAKDGVVTLTGIANWNFQRVEAEETASDVRGVRALTSEIVLIPTSSEDDIKQAINERFERNAAVDAENLSVETVNGKVILSGFVSSWTAREAAVEGAWSVPNVTEVEDRIIIAY